MYIITGPHSSDSSSNEEITYRPKRSQDTSNDRYSSKKQPQGINPSTTTTTTYDATGASKEQPIIEKGEVSQPELIPNSQSSNFTTPHQSGGTFPLQSSSSLHVATIDNKQRAIPTAVQQRPSPQYNSVKGGAAKGTHNAPPPGFKFCDPPKKPAPGCAGRPIQLTTNHFEIHFPEYGEIYHYHVDIEPGKCPKILCRRIIKQLETVNREKLRGIKLAFDGSESIYTSKPLPTSPIVSDIV